MSDIVTAVAVNKPSSGMVGYVNRRARLLGGGSFVLMGLVLFAGTLPAPNAGSVGIFVGLGVLALVLGIRMAYACALYVAPPVLELRFLYRTRRIPLTEVDHCETRLDQSGLLYRCIYLNFILKDGREVVFNLVQWPLNNPDVAEDACRQLDMAMRADA